MSLSVLLLLAVLLAGCAGSDHVGVGDPAGDAARRPAGQAWRDWAVLDARFPRDLLILTYLFDMVPQRDPFAAYTEATTYDAPEDSLGLDAYRALPAADRARRRDLASARRDRALALRRALNAWWDRARDNPGGYSPTGEPPEFAGEGVTMALGHLVAATGLDPTDARSWADLAALAAIVGDGTRSERAIAAGLAALDATRGAGLAPAEAAAIRQRLLLERAWAERDSGRFEACLATVAAAADALGLDEIATPDLAFEVRLLQALALAESGHASEARRLATNLPTRHLPRRQKTFIRDSEMSRAVDKNALQSVASDFATRWVRALAFMHLDLRDRALTQFMEPDFRTEFPPHLNHRFWNDAGRVQEHFGELPAARLSWVMAAVDRPLFVYFPFVGAHGTSRIYGQAGAGRLYFLAYRHFYLGGSRFGYAANRVLAVELAGDPFTRRARVQEALTALDACRRLGIRPAATLALRGRVHYRAGDLAAAEQDLTLARGLLQAAGRPDPDTDLLLGVLRFNRDDYAGAAPIFATYTRMRPDEALGWRLLGLALIHAGQDDKALAALDRALELEPDSAAGRYNRALLHLQRGELDAARDDLVHARRLWPDNADIARLGDLLATDRVPRVSLAHDTLDVKPEVAAADTTGSAKAGTPLRLVGAEAGTLERLGVAGDDADELVAAWRARYARDPTRENRVAYAWLLLQADRARGAVDLLAPHWSTGLSPEELELLLRAERDLGRTTHARQLLVDLERGRPGPGDPAIWELVGAICLENGAAAAARRAFERALELDPGNAHLQRLAGGTGPR